MSENDNSREEVLHAFLDILPCPDFNIERESAQMVQERDLFSSSSKDDYIKADYLLQ